MRVICKSKSFDATKHSITATRRREARILKWRNFIGRWRGEFINSVARLALINFHHLHQCLNASASPLKLLLLHLACGLGLAFGFWVAFNFYSFSLIQNSAETLRLVWAVEVSVVIPLYSLFRHNPDQCSYVKAIVRGLLSLPAGALVNALGAIVLGAPVGIQYFSKSVHWSLLMSVFTFVPAACVYGSSWTEWHRVFAHTKLVGSTDFIICLPTHGAVIGAWFGAWPMPLDWERPWQEWPVCVTYGAVLGYLVGMVVSSGFVFYNNKRHHGKGD